MVYLAWFGKNGVVLPGLGCWGLEGWTGRVDWKSAVREDLLLATASQGKVKVVEVVECSKMHIGR